VSAVAPVDADFASEGINKVGLLGTRVVLHARLYGQLVRTDAVVCDDDLDRLGTLYQAMAVRSSCSEDNRTVFFATGQRMVDEHGVGAVVLTGTDLNLAFDGVHDPGYRVIDALDVHVAVLADRAAGRTALPSA
jgi:aspartate racemase